MRNIPVADFLNTVLIGILIVILVLLVSFPVVIFLISKLAWDVVAKFTLGNQCDYCYLRNRHTVIYETARFCPNCYEALKRSRERSTHPIDGIVFEA